MALRCAVLAPRTWRNRERHATRYIAHMRERGLNHVAHNTASLHRALPVSVANALSGARA